MGFISKGNIHTKSTLNSKQKYQRLIFRKEILQVLISGALIAMLIQGTLTSTISFAIEFHFSKHFYVFSLLIGATSLAGFLQAMRWSWEPFLARMFGSWSDGPKGRLPPFLISLCIASLGFIGITWKLPIMIWVTFPFITLLAATALTTLIDSIAADMAAKTDTQTVMTYHSVSLDLGAALGPFISYILIELNHGLYITYFGGAFIFICLFVWWIFEDRRIKNYLDKSKIIDDEVGI
ncbi:hypothetical protein JOC48_003746 [Aquibacillus albus]|uniref:MFS transporter n=1 Tax=Aquibacillus albus TaxID=1168171 RepID=A0ABS2N5N1_9BACI|nr:hypothetical protein [Aquibacillus albus]